MTIALFTTWLDGWYQTQLWRGAVAACRIHGARLLCLVGYAPHLGSAENPHPVSTGPDAICGLGARPQIDGVLLPVGPITFWEGTKALDRIYTWLPTGRATVCLGQERPQVPSVVPDGGGIGDLVRHLVRVHGARRLVYMEGPPTNTDSIRRSDDFLVACAQEGIEFDPRLCEVGFFYLEGGERAMEKILARNVPFDAVVCANDAMAMGAARVMARHGLLVPEHVLLVGYDDCEESRTHQPPLTTIRSPTFQIGFRGLERALEICAGVLASDDVEIHSTSLVVRKSCGCLVNGPTPKMDGGTASSRILPTPSQFAEQLLPCDADAKTKFLRGLLATLRAAEDGELEEWQNVLYQASRLALDAAPWGEQRQEVEELVLQAHSLLSEAREGIQTGQRMAMDGLVRQLHVTMHKLQSNLGLAGFAQRLAVALQVWCPDIRLFLFCADLAPKSGQNLATCRFGGRYWLRDGVVAPIPDDQDLLPPESGNCEIWIGLPIEHIDNQFGVMLFRDWPHSESFVEHMRLVVSNYLFSVWRDEEERRRQKELHSRSVHDHLTGLYNRRGLLELGEMVVALARREGRKLGILMADLDGLKEINDHYGHAEGDLAIIALGDALRDSLRTSDTVARLGGDEFAAVFLLGESVQEAVLLDRIRRNLVRQSVDLARAWSVRTSLGLFIWDPGDWRSLEAVLADADAELYRDKHRRKSNDR